MYLDVVLRNKDSIGTSILKILSLLLHNVVELNRKYFFKGDVLTYISKRVPNFFELIGTF